MTKPNNDNASADLSNLRAYVNSRIAQGRENIKALFRDNVQNCYRLGLIARLIRQREEGLPSQIFWEESWDSVPAPFSEEDLEQIRTQQQRMLREISDHIHMHTDTQYRNTTGMGCGPAPIMAGGYHVYQPNPDPATSAQAEFVTVHFGSAPVVIRPIDPTPTPAKPSTTEYREQLEAKGWTEIQEVRVGMQTQVWAVRPGGVCPEPINPEKEARE